MFCGNSSGMGDLYAHSELCRQYIYIYIYIYNIDEEYFD